MNQPTWYIVNGADLNALTLVSARAVQVEKYSTIKTPLVHAVRLYTVSGEPSGVICKRAELASLSDEPRPIADVTCIRCRSSLRGMWEGKRK